MSWQMRREGSPHATSGLTANQVLEGLKEGVWEVSDEVRGPKDIKWTPLESHPFFEEALADLEEPVRHSDLEEHLDMNPLIDVALVLLIFFILTTSYEALRKVIEMPTASKKQHKVISTEDAKARFVLVKASRVEGGKVLYKVDEQEVEERFLEDAFRRAVLQGRKDMIIDAENVTWGTVTNIMDAGKAAEINSFKMKVSTRSN
jgi:biopolymer transport protein ExbD